MNNEYQENPDRQGNQDQYGNQQEPYQGRNQREQYGNQQGGYGNQREQYGNQQGGYDNQQGQFGNQQGGYDNQREQYGNQQGQFGNQQGGYGNQQAPYQHGNQGPDGLLKEPRNMAEQQIDQVIDQYANKVPGGQGFTKQAKDAVGGILDNLEQEGEKRIGDFGGGLFGGHKGNQ